MSLWSVSYTHLDVYKRQGRTSSRTRRNRRRKGVLTSWFLPFLLFGSRCYRFCPLLSGGGTPDGKVRFFYHRGSPFSFRYHRSRIVLERSCRVGSSLCDSGSRFLSFIWLGYGSRWDYLAFCPYRRYLFMVDGSCLYHRNRSPFCHSSPIRNLSPFPDGWGNRLHGWFSCMSGICMMSEIFRLLCSNRAFMDGSRPFGGFGSCLLRLFCLFQFRPAFCNGLSAALDVYKRQEQGMQLRFEKKNLKPFSSN